MRSAWQEHVAKTRKRGNRGKSTMTHREAMKEASLTWGKEKAKLIRRKKRECKKRSVSAPPAKKAAGSESKNDHSEDA